MILCLYVGVKHVISCFIYSCFLCLLGCRAGDRQPVRVRESHAKYQTLLGRPTEGKFDSLSLQLWYYLMVMLSVHGVAYLKYCTMLHWGFLFFAFKIKTSISIILPLIHYTTSASVPSICFPFQAVFRDKITFNSHYPGSDVLPNTCNMSIQGPRLQGDIMPLPFLSYVCFGQPVQHSVH